MKKSFVGILIVVLLFAITSIGGAEQTDLLDSNAGASIVSASTEYSAGWGAPKLIDQTTAYGWCSAQGAALPHIIVIQLGKTAAISEFAIDNTGAQEDGYPGISARQFDLYASTQSDSGFQLVLSGEAAKGARKSFSSFHSNFKANFLKLVILSNWGNESYTEIMELDAFGEPISPEKEQQNLLSGARVVSASSEYGAGWAAQLLLDQNTGTGWCSADKSPFPHVIVIELARPSKVWQFVIDNTAAQEGGYPGISARRFELYASDTNGTAESDYRLVLSGEAGKGARREFELNNITEARLLKLVVLSNWGHDTWTEIMEIEAYGKSFLW